MIAFLHGNLFLILLSLSGVLVAGGGTLLVRHLVTSARKRRDHDQRGGRKPSKARSTVTIRHNHRRRRAR